MFKCKKKHINISEDRQKVFTVWNHKYLSAQFLTQRATGLCNITQETSQTFKGLKVVDSHHGAESTRCEHSTKGPTLTFPFSYRWGGGGRGGWREMTWGIQQGAPLIIQSVALETREEVEKSILSNSFLCTSLRQVRKHDRNTVNNILEIIIYSFNKHINKTPNVLQ